MNVSEENAKHFLCPLSQANGQNAQSVYCYGSVCMAWQPEEGGRGECGMVHQSMAIQLDQMRAKLPGLVAATHEAIKGDRLGRLTDENRTLRAALFHAVEWMERGGKNNNQPARDIIEAGKVALYGPEESRKVPGEDL